MGGDSENAEGGSAGDATLVKATWMSLALKILDRHPATEQGQHADIDAGLRNLRIHAAVRIAVTQIRHPQRTGQGSGDTADAEFVVQRRLHARQHKARSGGRVQRPQRGQADQRQYHQQADAHSTQDAALAYRFHLAGVPVAWRVHRSGPMMM
jgi:hypothetical protein